MPAPSSKSNLYDRLGVARGADAGEIRKAYMKLARTHHPDKGGDAEEFKQIQKAYEVLSDDGRRATYDATGQEDEGGGGGGGGGPGGPGMPFPFPFDLGSMFGGMGGFGGMFGPGGPRRPGAGGQQPKAPKAPPKIHEMPVSLWDYYHGKRVKIQFERQKFCGSCKGSGAESLETCGGCGGSGAVEQRMMIGPGMMSVTRMPCGSCEGSGKRVAKVCGGCGGKKFHTEEKVLEVVIQPGMVPGDIIKFERECSDQAEYMEAGDVHIVLQEADEEIRFKRHPTQRHDLIVMTAVTLTDMLLGCKQVIEGHPGHPAGLSIEIPVGVQNKERIEIAGEGMVRGSSAAGVAERGTLHVFVEVRASDSEKEKLRGAGDELRRIMEVTT